MLTVLPQATPAQKAFVGVSSPFGVHDKDVGISDKRPIRWMYADKWDPWRLLIVRLLESRSVPILLADAVFITTCCPSKTSFDLAALSLRHSNLVTCLPL